MKFTAIARILLALTGLFILLIVTPGCNDDLEENLRSYENIDNLQNYYPVSDKTVELLIKTGHKYRARNFALSPDGKILISTDVEGKVKAWDTRKGRLLRDLDAFPDAVYSSVYSPDGKYFAATSFRGELRVWSIPDFKIIRKTDNFANKIAFSPNSKLLAATHYGESIKLLDTNEFNVIKDFEIKSDDFSCLAFSPDSTLIAAGHSSGDVDIWDARTGKLIKTLDGLYFWVYSVRFSPDGKKLMGASCVLKLGSKWKELYRLAYGLEPFDEEDSQQGLPGDITKFSEKYSNIIKNGKVPKITNPNTDVVVWDIATGKQVLSYPHPKSAYCADYSKDGKIIASVGADNRICVKDAVTGKTIASHIIENAKFLNYLIFTPDGKSIYFSGGDGVIRLYDFRKDKIVKEFARCESLVQSVAVSSDGEFMASGGEDKIIRIWNMKTQELVNEFDVHRKAIQEVRFDKSGNYLLAGSSDGSITIRQKDGDNGFKFYKGIESVRPIMSVDVTDDLKIIAAGDVMGYVTFWDFETGKQIRRQKTHRESVLCVRFTPDGKKLLVSSHNEYDDTIKVLDVSTGNELMKFSGEGHPAWSICLLPGTETFLFSGGSFIKKADMTTGKVTEANKGDRGAIWSMAISPDGKKLVTGGFRGELNIWDLNGFKKINSFAGDQGEIESVAWMPDGSFVSAGSESSIRVWAENSDKPEYTLYGFRDKQWIIYKEDGRFKSSPDVAEFVGGAVIGAKAYKALDYFNNYKVTSF
ncbi:MAG: hypothetical protein LWY06_12335 [Firmicutes bacterium]|nr:hypothetical protein [Bacillota bacterium]